MIGIIILIAVLLIVGMAYEGGHLNSLLSQRFKKHTTPPSPRKYGGFATHSPSFMGRPISYALDNGISVEPNCGGWAPCLGM